MIADLKSRREKLGHSLEFSPAARRHILATIDTPHYGARPLKRKLEQIVENRIAEVLIGQPEQQNIQVDLAKEDKNIRIVTRPKEAKE